MNPCANVCTPCPPCVVPEAPQGVAGQPCTEVTAVYKLERAPGNGALDILFPPTGEAGELVAGEDLGCILQTTCGRVEEIFEVALTAGAADPLTGDRVLTVVPTIPDCEPEQVFVIARGYPQGFGCGQGIADAEFIFNAGTSDPTQPQSLTLFVTVQCARLEEPVVV